MGSKQPLQSADFKIIHTTSRQIPFMSSYTFYKSGHDDSSVTVLALKYFSMPSCCYMQFFQKEVY